MTDKLIQAISSAAACNKNNPNNLPNIRKELIKRQKGICPISGINLKAIAASNVVVDHDHETGIIRAALPRALNGLEGKLVNLCIRWGRCKSKRDIIQLLRSMADYLEHHLTPQTEWIHPTHLTPLQKRAKANEAARKRRAAKKKDKET
ncbi:endonuclease VII [Marinomonas phage CB5A]|uniref:Endonuclease n=1 Tax=Marinomonas phage CB5A TaxID=2022859 RepID=A0A222G2W4_9CAUD|nr:endonuclease VII [Marinomonas phage CB5A]ASP46275.1 endonuclease [Marinomonas phage CB5A]